MGLGNGTAQSPPNTGAQTRTTIVTSQDIGRFRETVTLLSRNLNDVNQARQVLGTASLMLQQAHESPQACEEKYEASETR